MTNSQDTGVVLKPDEIIAGLVVVIGLPFAMALDFIGNLAGWARR